MNTLGGASFPPQQHPTKTAKQDGGQKLVFNDLIRIILVIHSMENQDPVGAESPDYNAQWKRCGDERAGPELMKNVPFVFVQGKDP